MGSKNGIWVIARENNIVRVDFSRTPEPPKPRFPGANGVREMSWKACELQSHLSTASCRAA
jgi:hypothetical protein